MANFFQLGLRIPHVLLPDETVDLKKWAVIACDQYTSEPSYWDEVARYVGDCPSTLNMIYPECYLGGDDARTASILAAMRAYRQSVLTRSVERLILVRRETTTGDRLGLLAEVDLERYDFDRQSRSQIRATEGTILSRLPPRVKIRKEAALELPHVMLLIDDPEHTLLQPLAEAALSLAPLYDFAIMSGERLRGWALDDRAQSRAEAALSALNERAGGMLFAVGDGNHSLAAARQCWLDVKPGLNEAERENHPARYALVEICNLHDPALVFEPIHRVVFEADDAALTHDFILWCRARGMIVRPCAEEMAQLYLLDSPLRIENARDPLPVAILQPFLDEWLAAHPEARVDYIHDLHALEQFAGQRACRVRLCAMDKATLFPSVRQNGPLPRKAFSLGAARDKRFYLECRALY